LRSSIPSLQRAGRSHPVRQAPIAYSPPSARSTTIFGWTGLRFGPTFCGPTFCGPTFCGPAFWGPAFCLSMALLWSGFVVSDAGATEPEQASGSKAIDFNRDIRSLLSNRCFHCHGPDEAERQGGGRDGLRLDTVDGAIEDLGGYAAIAPGDPSQSALIERITSNDPDLVMPPPSMGKPLSSQEIATFRQWIAEGATYATHWSYAVPQRPAVPTVKDPSWPRQPIDSFVLARLDREGLTPQPMAQRAALLRRVAVDLTGLPPPRPLLDRFLADPSDDAYSRAVDALLLSSGYGEHWARMWLDQARYADSAGYADDPPRTIWAYRDWVIDAINDNMPFDQFTIEQLAGDLLPNPSPSQQVATAFHRNTMTNNEGGTNDEEFRNAAIVDRVNTTYAVWMGTTMACAQCHTHKFDPISQREYFESFAIFNNTADADLRDEEPLIKRYSETQLADQQSLRQQLADVDAQLQSQSSALAQAQQQWEQSLESSDRWNVLPIASAASNTGVELKTESDGSVRSLNSGRGDKTTVVLSIVQPRLIHAIRLEALADASLPGRGPGWGGGNFVITHIEATLLDPAIEQRQTIDWSRAVADFEQADFSAAAAIAATANPATGWAISPQMGQDHALVLVLKSPIEAKAGQSLQLIVEQRSNWDQHTLGRFRLSVTDTESAIDQAMIPTSILQIVRTPPESRTSEQKEALAKHYMAIAPQMQSLQSKRLALQQSLQSIKPLTTVPVMAERSPSQRRQTHVQLRGNWQALGDQVGPSAPTAFHPSGTPIEDRLAFAQWLVSRENPLTARVAVNRIWEQLFGTGLVATAEEFGSQGDAPSHPELLDWLAVEYLESGWDTKRLIKRIVTSATYMQSSRVTPVAYSLDPDNRLLARGPRFRLPAETVRDQALSIAGLLSGKLHGPPVKPMQPEMGLTAAFGGNIDWQTSSGEDRYRRAIYTTWRRSNPYPSMAAFDAPTREVCLLRRTRTNTPLQALVTLNDPVYLEAAQALARRIIAIDGDVPRRAAWGLQACLGRTASETETEALVTLFHQALTAIGDDRSRAEALATQPLGPAPEGADLQQLAAWTIVCNALLNLDELVMKP
jgi:hypothetical protein